jgi:hypothetical protein
LAIKIAAEKKAVLDMQAEIQSKKNQHDEVF